MTQMTDEKPSERRIDEADFLRIAKHLHRLTGIYLTAAKRAMVASRLRQRVKAVGLGSLTAYADLIHSPAGAAELEEMIQALTTNMTRFDREATQFAHFDAEVMPDLAARARAGERVRLWSAGCSSGEEAYSLGFRVLDHCPEAARLDLRILATDIDRRILERATGGRYAPEQLAPLSPLHRARYFDWPDGGDVATTGPLIGVDDALRAITAFRLLNLLSEWPFRGRFDVIMCRNVTIYFDAETQLRLWRRFFDQLEPGGVLYIGHSEVIRSEAPLDFDALGAGVFRKRGARLARVGPRFVGRSVSVSVSGSKPACQTVAIAAPVTGAKGRFAEWRIEGDL
ncbi:CheR family methyltransferase [Rhodalgimonas zhirmunskyi]|uniref:protein-glutamate O-methyltransferase n=1 Tax=Rhodalgimonas zhirmunskyi TaxID=2964767 RepID=A0AAJ1UBZ1_9RHOB|nr:protein-glutamate O-methyltransferase [Rhodoalgimonas zhirmunskyi]MDQ2095715.1 protein-glutamate O-methyltransferase [Rhodoalgimonas zhirmunskyi]